MTMEVGQTVSAFQAQTIDKTIALSDYLGKNVVLFFYPKDNTPGCTMESKDFRDHAAEFAALNTVVIGVSCDSVQSHCKFRDKYDLNFEMISDEDKRIASLFDVYKEKSMFGKKYMGIERSTFLIDKNGVLQKAWRKVSVLNHVKRVLAAVKQINESV
jgi:peroxiredoxin Q/BCP